MTLEQIIFTRGDTIVSGDPGGRHRVCRCQCRTGHDVCGTHWYC